MGEGAEVHSLPCTVQYTGEARVSAYLLVSTDENNPNVSHSTFRGRHLVGTQAVMPAGCDAVVLKAAHSPAIESATNEREYQATPVKSITIWGADFPRTAGSWRSVASWVETARAIHQ